MSLVNQMLRDLESRQQHQDGESYIQTESIVEANDHSHFKGRLIAAFAVVLIVCCIAWLVWLNLSSNKSDQVPVIVDQHAPAVSAPLVPDDGAEVRLNGYGTTAETLSQQQIRVAPQAEAESATIEDVQARDVPLEAVAAQPPESQASETKESLAQLAEQTAEFLSAAEPTSHKDQKDAPVLAKTAPKAEDVALPIEPPARLAEQSAQDRTLPDPLIARRITPDQLDQDIADAAQALASNGQWQQAIAHLNEFIDEHKTHLRAYETLISLEMARANTTVVESLAAQIPKQKNSPRLRMLKARHLAQSSQGHEATQLLASDLPSVSEHSDYYELMAALYQQLGEAQKAAAIYSQLVSFDPNRANWWAGQAVALDTMGRSENARLGYRQALQLEGLDPQLAQFARDRVRALN